MLATPSWRKLVASSNTEDAAGSTSAGESFDVDDELLDALLWGWKRN